MKITSEIVLKKLKQVLNHLYNFLIDGAYSLVDLVEKKQGYNAEFGSESDIGSRLNKGFLYSLNRKLTRRKSFEGLLLCSNTGSGKTVRIITKILFELKNCSIICNDPSKELYTITSGYLSQHFTIRILNFSDSSVSCGYNILSAIKKPNDINKIAHLLVSASLEKGNADPFWIIQSKSVISIFIRLVLLQPEQYRNMANVLFLLNNFAARNTDKIDEFIAMSNDPQLILDYKTMIANSEKTLQSIISSSKASIQLFEDSQIAKVTAHSSIQLDDLRKKPTIIFLHNSISDMKYINVLNGIFFEQLYGHFLQNLPKKDELDCFVILEEASSLHIPILPIASANVRKHRVANLICIQNPEQLKTFYKEEYKSLVSNCRTHIYLSGLSSLDTMRELEQLSGRTTYTDDKGVEKTRPLLSIDEIRLLPENRSIIISSNTPIIRGRTSPYFKCRKYRLYSQIPPIDLKGDIPDDPLTFIPL